MADGVPQRGISSEFKRELKEGVLQPILDLVKNDDTLSLEIRNGYVDIYYRGGLLLGLEEQSRGRFSAVFDEEYLGKTADYRIEPKIVPPPTITAPGDTAAWLDVMPIYKQAMDIRFSLHPKLEREFEQLAERDNGRHEVGEQTDYLIVDIEYAQSSRACPGWPSGCRFDMAGFRWPIEGKTRRCKLATPVIMEMKVGDGVITSRPEGKDRKLSPGLLKHVIDIEAFLKPAPGEAFSEAYRLLREELIEMFRTKQELRLPSVPKNMADLEIEGLTERPEVLFVLANHNPRSRKLLNELERIARIPYGEHADYKVATVTYGGYGIFRNNVVPLQDFDATPKRG
jgi:hypothetical protein